MTTMKTQQGAPPVPQNIIADLQPQTIITKTTPKDEQLILHTTQNTKVLTVYYIIAFEFMHTYRYLILVIL